MLVAPFLRATVYFDSYVCWNRFASLRFRDALWRRSPVHERLRGSQREQEPLESGICRRVQRSAIFLSLSNLYIQSHFLLPFSPHCLPYSLEPKEHELFLRDARLNGGLRHAREKEGRRAKQYRNARFDGEAREREKERATFPLVSIHPVRLCAYPGNR